MLMPSHPKSQESSAGNITPSKYQADVLGRLNTPGNIFVEAVAGAAKTTTLEMIAGRLPKGAPALFLAYNKHIQEELSKRLSSHPSLKVNTVHSLGYALIRSYLPKGTKLTVSDQKLEFLYDKQFGIKQEEFTKYKKDNTAFLMRGSVLKFARYAKQCGVIPVHMEQKRCAMVKNEKAFWNDAMLELGMVDSLRDQCAKMPINTEFAQYFGKVVDRANSLLEKSINDMETIDYDDMLYLPVILNAKSRWHQYQYLLIDETQDFSELQMRIVDLVINPMTKIIGVGDPRQSIYAFRGADSNAISNFVAKYKCTVMPLPICYRCAKSIVTLAQEYNPAIMPFENNKDGSVYEYEKHWNPLTEKLTSNDMILSRLNKILIHYAIVMIKNNISFQYVGRDFGAELKAVLKQVKKATVCDTRLALSEWAMKMVRKYMASGKQQEASSVLDKKSSLELLIDYALGMSSQYSYDTFICETLDKIFSKQEKPAAVRISTIHRSKGLQADRVFLVDFDMLPLTMDGMTSRDTQQELNIMYVGVTRAKSELHFVRTPEAFRRAHYPKYEDCPRSDEYRLYVTKLIKSDGSIETTTRERQQKILDGLRALRSDFDYGPQRIERGDMVKDSWGKMVCHEEDEEY